MTDIRTAPRTEVEKGIHRYLTIHVTMRRGMPGGGHPYPYLCADDFILTHGRFYESAPLTEAERAYLTKVLKTYGRRLEKKQCFYNSQLVLLTAATWMAPVEGMTLRYVEGYAAGHVLPVHHGWLTLNGKVIDTTLRMPEVHPRKAPLPHRTVGIFPETMGYFGVPFRTEEVRASVVERGEGGSLLEDFKRKFPFLRTPYEVAA